MKVIDPGHAYELSSIDGVMSNVLVFVKRVGEGYPGNHNSYPGTQTQEVLRALIDRARYLHNQVPCMETEASIRLMQMVIMLYEQRHARKHGRTLKSILDSIELIPTCAVCGHIECEEHHARP